MQKKWAELSPEEKREERFKSWLSPQGVEFTSTEAEKLYKERVTRIIDAIQLKVPDRVPVCPSSNFFPVYYAGITPETAMYDYAQLYQVWRKFNIDFQPDALSSAGAPGPGKVYEILDYKLYTWPGHGNPPDVCYQCIEAEYMKADEYDALIHDPSDFWFRLYMPRIFGALVPLGKLSPFTSIIEMPTTAPCFVPYGMPDVQAAFQALLDAGREAVKWLAMVRLGEREMLAAGFAYLRGGGAKAPFDVIGDTLRGTRGIMLDMYRQPAKLLEAMERLVPIMIERGVSQANASGGPIVSMPLHKGAEGFMSDQQFRTFYWPTLKKVILGFIDEGLVPRLFAEGEFNKRLEYLLELPKGKTIWWFDQTDMAKAKEVLGDTVCLMGNVPSSLLCIGKPGEVKNYCQKLIDVAGRDGGFILSSGSAIDDAKPENVKMMIDFTKEYGVYR